jgi:hypothetical protein
LIPLPPIHVVAMVSGSEEGEPCVPLFWFYRA